MKIGTRYGLPSGGQVLVTNSGEGTLTDGDVELLPHPAEYDREPIRTNDPKKLVTGKRWGFVRQTLEPQPDGTEKEVVKVTELVLVVKTGEAELRFNGEELEELKPKVLPSAD